MSTIEDLAAALPYGCSIWYAVRIQGVTTWHLEESGDATAPAGYTLDASLVMEGAPRLGGVVDPRSHLGAAFDFVFSFADSASVRALFSRPTLVTTLTAACSATDTSISFDTTGWPAAGVLHINDEAIPYTGVTGTAATGCTRGDYGLASAHVAGAVVANGPRYWVGRRVDLIAVQMDGTGRYTSGGAVTVWTGRVVARPVRGSVTWDLQARSLDRRLTETLGTAAEGMAWWDIDDDALVSFDPAALVSAQVHEVVNDLGVSAWHTIETCVLQPWAAMTSPVRASALREALRVAWDAYSHAVGIGSGQWAASLDATGMLRTYAFTFYYAAQFVSGHDTAQLIVHTTVDGQSPLTLARVAVVGSTDAYQGQTVSEGGQWVEMGLRQPATVRGASLSVTLTDTAPSELPASGWVRLGDKDGAEFYRYLSHSTDPVVSSRVHLQLDPATQPDITALGLLDASEAGRVELDVTFLWRAQGSVADVMRQMLLSRKGDLANGAFDVIGPGGGYGLDEADVDTDSFDRVFDGALASLSCDLAIDGQVSFQRVFGDLLRLSNRAVMVVDSDTGPKVTAINLGPPDGPAVASFTDADLAWSSESPTAPVRPSSQREQVPGRIEVSAIPGTQAPGSPDPVPLVVRNVEGPEFGGDAWSLKLYGFGTSALVGPAFAWGRAYFVAAETRQVVEIDVSPAVRVKAGDIVSLELEDPTLWDYATGTPGYAGLARVLGVQTHPLALVRTLTVAIGGMAASGALSPSAEVLAYAGAPDDPSTISVHLDYLAVMQSYLVGVAYFDLQLYVAGFDAAGVVGYRVTAVSSAGGVCVLSGAMTGTPVSLAGGDVFRLTLPLLEDGNAAQAAYIHSGQAVQWS